MKFWYTILFVWYALLRLLVNACIKVVKKCTPGDTFFRNHEKYCVPKMSLSYLQNMPIYFSSGKYKLSIHSFLIYCYTIVFGHNFLHPSKWCLVHNKNVHKICSALNLKIICITPFTCNNTTFSVSFLNEIYLFHQ